MHVAYRDPWVQRARLDDAVDEALGYEPGWIVQMIRELGEDRGATIGLSGPVAPGLLDGADPDRIRRDLPPGRREALENMTAARLNWSAIPCPTAGWAALVHPDLDADAALARLWEQVVHICRVDEPDPVAAWGERMDQIERAKAALNELRLDAVHLRGPGTDLEIGLLPSSQWMGGAPDHQLRARAPSQPADRGGLRGARPGARPGHGALVEAAPARRLGRARLHRRVRRRPGQADRGGRERRGARGVRREGRGGEPPGRDRPRRRPRAGRAAPDGLLRHADRRERGIAHGARPGLRLGGRRRRHRAHQPQPDPRRLHVRLRRGGGRRRHGRGRARSRSCVGAPGRSERGRVRPRRCACGRSSR